MNSEPPGDDFVTKCWRRNVSNGIRKVSSRPLRDNTRRRLPVHQSRLTTCAGDLAAVGEYQLEKTSLKYAIAVAEAAERIELAMEALGSLEPFDGKAEDVDALKTFEEMRAKTLAELGGDDKNMEVARAAAEKAVAASRIQWAKAAVSEKQRKCLVVVVHWFRRMAHPPSWLCR